MTIEPEIQPLIRLDSFHLSRLNFNIDERLWENNKLDDTKFKINFTQLLKEDKDNYFGILFTVIVQNTDETIKLDFDFLGHFEVKNIQLDDNNLETNTILKSSAPAIIFPYIRAFISNFTINAGFNPIILPAINFHASKKQ